MVERVSQRTKKTSLGLPRFPMRRAFQIKKGQTVKLLRTTFCLIYHSQFLTAENPREYSFLNYLYLGNFYFILFSFLFPFFSPNFSILEQIFSYSRRKIGIYYHNQTFYFSHFPIIYRFYK